MLFEFGRDVSVLLVAHLCCEDEDAVSSEGLFYCKILVPDNVKVQLRYKNSSDPRVINVSIKSKVEMCI